MLEIVCFCFYYTITLILNLIEYLYFYFKKKIDCKFTSKSKVSTKYNLIANICHEGKKDEELNKTLTRMEHEGIKGTCVVDVTNKGDDNWYRIQDLTVKETMPQEITVSEAYIQIYERQD